MIDTLLVIVILSLFALLFLRLAFLTGERNRSEGMRRHDRAVIASLNCQIESYKAELSALRGELEYMGRALDRAVIGGGEDETHG